VLNITQREDLPQGFAVHETSTISTVWPWVWRGFSSGIRIAL
jgi:hypothetical protein